MSSTSCDDEGSYDKPSEILYIHGSSPPTRSLPMTPLLLFDSIQQHPLYVADSAKALNHRKVEVQLMRNHLKQQGPIVLMWRTATQQRRNVVNLSRIMELVVVNPRTLAERRYREPHVLHSQIYIDEDQRCLVTVGDSYTLDTFASIDELVQCYSKLAN